MKYKPELYEWAKVKLTLHSTGYVMYFRDLADAKYWAKYNKLALKNVTIEDHKGYKNEY